MRGWGCDRDSGAAFEIIDAPSSRLTRQSLCLYVSVHVRADTILCQSRIGRKILSVRSSFHHLFLARLLISVLIISCSPLSVEVWRTCLISVLFPILIFHSFSSIHPSIYPSIAQDKMLQVSISPSSRYFQVCMWHRLCTTLTFLLTYAFHITCISPHY